MIGLLLFAAAAAAHPKLNCKSPVTQADLDICTNRDANAADAEMLGEYGVARVILKNMDREIDRKFDKLPSYSAALLASQLAWFKFRKAQCEIEGYSARGGTIEPMIENECFERVTRDRTKQLQEMLKLYAP